MDRHLKKIVNATSNGDLDSLKKLYVLHKNYFGTFLYDYAIRNNQINIIDYFYKNLLFDINGISHHSLISSNGGRNYCKIETIQHIVDNCGLKDPIIIYQRCIDIMVNNRKFKKAVIYAKGFKSYYPGSINHLLIRFDQAYPIHATKPIEFIEIYRDISIENILE